MSKFKVGDKVRYVKRVLFHNDDVMLNNIYTITRLCETGSYSVKETSDNFREEELQKAEFTKSDLKPHHIVEDGNGDKNIWEQEDADDYNDDMEYLSMGDRDEDYDIMKVYEFETLVWERETEAEEMTVAEIEEALGKKVKIIKGGE